MTPCANIDSDKFRALFGGVLAEGFSVRYIYVDEAGHSEPEPVTVVVGIIVKPDEHWVAVRKELASLKRTVPEHYRNGFIFHAKSIWGDRKFRDGWSLDDRLALIKGVLRIPAKFGLSIAVGKVRRDSGGQDILSQYGLDKKFSLAQWHHSQAFQMCAVKADAYLRERCAEREIGTLIYEDMPEMREHLRVAFEIARYLYIPYPEGSFEEASTPASLHQGITQIQDGVQFASKEVAPLLQVADACAFAFRRFVSGYDHAAELMEAMGLNLNFDEWQSPLSAFLFSPDPKRRVIPDAIHDEMTLP